MKEAEKFRQFLEFNTWANELLLNFLEKSENVDSNASEIFGHLLLAEKEWLDRVTEKSLDATGADFWAIKTVADCRKLFDENRRNYEQFFSEMSAEELARTIVYKNSRGEEFSNNLDEVFSHVFFHSAQHRGQISKLIRNGGETPPYTDFIGFLRK